MSKLLDQILDQIPHDAFTDVELLALLGNKSDASRYNQVKRALAKGELIQLRRGLYLLGTRYQRNKVNSYELAQRIYGPSYISFESALSYYSLIPEGVQSVTSATAKRSRQFETPQGVFAYTQIPLPVFPVGVERIESEGQVFLMARPLKALADYVYANRLNWLGLEPVVQSLRIDRGDLMIEQTELLELEIHYKVPRVSRFLKGLKKDLA